MREIFSFIIWHVFNILCVCLQIWKWKPAQSRAFQRSRSAGAPKRTEGSEVFKDRHEFRFTFS